MRRRKLLLLLPALSVLLAAAAESQNATALVGRWEGTLVPTTQRQRGSRAILNRPPPLPMVVVIAADANGRYVGTWESVQQKDTAPLGEVAIDGARVRINVPTWNGSWEGKLSADGSTLDGTWRQGAVSPPLVLKKTAQ